MRTGNHLERKIYEELRRHLDYLTEKEKRELTKKLMCIVKKDWLEMQFGNAGGNAVLINGKN